MVPYGGQALARLARSALTVAAAFPAVAGAQLLPDPAPPGAARVLDQQTGKVTVKGGIATIDLPAGWRYLQQDDARAVIERQWGNRPNPGTLGLILPPASWGGIIVTWEARGWVRDDDAEELDPEALLAATREDIAAGNPARTRAGQPTVELVGWAEPPRYDRAGRKLSWARILQLPSIGKRMLNYDVRVLGADGVLVMQAVADAEHLPQVAAGAREILARIELAPGRRYEDHDPRRHEIAPHGVVELVAGKRVSVPVWRLLVRVLLAVGVVVAGLRFGRR